MAQQHTSHRAAAIELARRDPVIARLVDIVGPPRLRSTMPTHFESIARSVVYQQLAGSAAAAIYGRLVDALGGSVTPEVLVATDSTVLRACGLSAAKAACLADLASRFADGSLVLEPAYISRRSDADIIEHLCLVRGIGRWTAEMFLLFQLRRLDVWPCGDLGVRRGYGLAWGVPTPSPGELADCGDAFRPFRSVAAWYCWRATEVCRGNTGIALTR